MNMELSKQVVTVFLCCLLVQFAAQAGIQCPESFLPARQSPSVLVLESGSSVDLDGAGVTGERTGMAVGSSTTTIPTSPTAEPSSIATALTTATSITAV